MKTANYITIILLASILFSCKEKKTYTTQSFFAPVSYQKPLVIIKGGHYSGSYKGTKDSAAIWIWTNDTVWIDNAIVLTDAGGGIRMSGGTKVIITNITVKGIKPDATHQYGRAIDNYMPAYFYMKGFDIDSTGGILFDHSRPGSSPLIQVYNGKIKNTLRLKGDGTGGGLRAGMQFNTVRNMNPTSEAAWIEWNNTPGRSCVEDNFNFYNSSNFTLHDFCIKGAYPYPVTASSYSGSGVTSDGSPQEGNAKATATHNFEVYNGTIISTCNAAANIAAGYNVNFHDLKIVSSGMLPDGTKSNRFWSGTCIFNGGKYPDSIFYNNSIKNCTIGFVNNGNENYPYSGRQDENKDRNVNKMPIGGNAFLNNPITLGLEKTYYELWQAKVSAQGITLGIPGTSQPQTPQPPVITHVDTFKDVVRIDTVRLPPVHDTLKYFITEKRVTAGYDTLFVKPK